MNQNNEDNVNKSEIDQLGGIFGGHIFFQTLRTAVQLGIFDVLKKEKSLTRQEIARKLNIEEQPLRIVMLGLTTTGLLIKQGSQFTNSRIANLFLTKDSPRKLTAYVELQHRVMYKGLYWLLDSVREYRNVGLKEFPGNEPTLYQRLAHDPELEKIFQDAMQELSIQTNAEMVQFLDLSDVNHLVDIGGGDGTNIIALAKRWPHLKATVFDSPTVCEIAKANIAAHGLADRLDAVPGNCFTDPFPEQADYYLFCHFFTIWGEQKDRMLLKKCHDALPPNGRVAIFNMMQHDDETGPLTAAIGSPYFLAIATGLGMLYTWNEYESWMHDAGFQKVQRHILSLDHGVIVGSKQCS